MDLLVTGFGPYPHVRINPTGALAHDVARRLRRAGLEAESFILETSYSGGLPALQAHLRQAQPRAVLMLGLAARARFVRVELFARGHASPLHLDVAGATPGARPPRPALPARTRAGPHGALAALRRKAIRARLSPSAGRYLCDAAYAAAMATTDAPVLFVHVPSPKTAGQPAARGLAFRPGRSVLSAALTGIGRELARRGRPGGPLA